MEVVRPIGSEPFVTGWLSKVPGASARGSLLCGKVGPFNRLFNNRHQFTLQ